MIRALPTNHTFEGNSFWVLEDAIADGTLPEMRRRNIVRRANGANTDYV